MAYAIRQDRRLQDVVACVRSYGEYNRYSMFVRDLPDEEVCFCVVILS
jgi:hypothetical protein